MTPHGHREATTDTSVIQAFFAQHSDANVGIRTGRDSGLLVLDIDPRHGGDDTLAELLHEHGKLPPTPEVLTGGGGRHLYFQHPGLEIRRHQLAPGVDVKSDGGYVVAPPSAHIVGEYVWEVSGHPDDVPLAELPAWLLGMLTTPLAASSLPVAYNPVEGIEPGRRNTELMRLGGSLRRAGGTEAAIRAALLAHNDDVCDPPLPQREVETIARSAARYEPEADAPHLTDVGNAQRLVRAHGADLRFVKAWSQWLTWDGKRWARDETSEALRRAKDTVARMYHEAAAITDDSKRRELAQHATKSEYASRIKAMVTLAESEPAIAVTVDRLDTDPWLLNVENGTVDLHTGTLRAHNRDDLITKLAPVTFDADATCPTWDAFLRRVLNADDELIRFVQRFCGYMLTASTAEQCFVVAHGIGANGKSTLFNTIATLMGDYARRTRTEALLLKKHDAASNDIARLHGARFVLGVEAEAGRMLAESLVKSLTGGDAVTARFLYQEAFDFTPTFKLVLAVNHRPQIKGTDNGIWRRVRLVPFGVVIPEEEQDKHLAERLHAELSGILRWAIEGCLAWQKDGLGMSEAVKTATGEYRAESDALEGFLASRCDRALVEATAGARAVYEAYVNWSAREGETAMSVKEFRRELLGHGFVPRKRNDGNVWLGLSLRQLETSDETSGGWREVEANPESPPLGLTEEIPEKRSTSLHPPLSRVGEVESAASSAC